VRAADVAISLNNFFRAAEKHAVFSVSLSDWLGRKRHIIETDTY
jgi:hypothetical protein